MKKSISLFLIFSLVMLSVNLYAKKRGAEILIVKKDGRHIKMELIAVKQNSLLLEDAISVDIKDVRIVRIEKTSRFWKRAGAGALIGVVTGVLVGASVGENDMFSAELTILINGILFSALGFLIGGIIYTDAPLSRSIFIVCMSNVAIGLARVETIFIRNSAYY